MIFTTVMLCNLPLHLTPATMFVTIATYLLYNFHKHSFTINYSNISTIVESVKKIRVRSYEVTGYLIAAILLVYYLFRLEDRIYPYLIPLALLAVGYSAPLIRRKGKKVRLKEVFFIKTPMLALVWALTTTIIPLVEQNINIVSSFVIWQTVSRTLFIFALCIPFEMRDADIDRKNNVTTLAVVHGRKTSQLIGVLVIVLEIVTHHFMNGISNGAIIGLDLSSIVALLLIFLQNNKRSGYYYKFIVDGMMILRFIFLGLLIDRL
jgi:4-hydroxybenzoate polyprenyltransferase